MKALKTIGRIIAYLLFLPLIALIILHLLTSSSIITIEGFQESVSFTTYFFTGIIAIAGNSLLKALNTDKS